VLEKYMLMQEIKLPPVMRKTPWFGFKILRSKKDIKHTHQCMQRHLEAGQVGGKESNIQ